MGRPANTDLRRTQIVAALLRVMATHGYERATIALVAREAKLGAGLVHYHFSSKEEILLVLIEGLAARAEARLEARVTRAGSALEKLDAALDALLARGEDDDREAVACWALIGAEAVKNTEVRALYGRFIGRLTERLSMLLVEVCRAEHRAGTGARAMAGALVALIEGYFALAAAVPDAIPVGSAATMARRMARGLVLAQPEKAASLPRASRKRGDR